MSQGVGLISNNVPGYGLSEARFLPCKGNSGRAVMLSPSSPCIHESFSRFKIFLKNNQCNDTRRPSFVCSANSGGHRRNPDFSRQNRQGHGFYRNKNRQNLERDDNLENLEESDFLASKNGPLLSHSGSPRFQATATPGPREREIVELFRKVQAQLRERAAIKEEKKTEASQGDRGTVDSLLNLLRKHSTEQGKKSRSNSNEDFNLDRNVRTSNPFDDEQNSNFFDSNTVITGDMQEPSNPAFSRPASNFRRKSPVPRIKYEPVYSTDEIAAPTPSRESQGKKNKNVIQPDPEPMSSDVQDDFEDDVEDDVNENVFAELSESSDEDEADDGDTELPPMENVDLSSMKLSELKDLAKSRGFKGYSKLKKSELIELLSGSVS